MLTTAIIMGFAGSLHCAGMCSPLAIAVTSRNPFLLAKLAYNTGRILTYSLLGTLAAALGSLVQLAPYQQVVSFTLGSVFLLLGLGGITGVRIPYVTAGINRFASWIKKIFGKVLRQKSSPATFLMGMVNGLLPCGLTYLALSACLILPTAREGFLFMFFFGLGTWPVMIGLTWILNSSIVRARFNLARFSRIALVLVGCLLFIRVWLTHPHASASTLEGKVSGMESVCE